MCVLYPFHTQAIEYPLEYYDEPNRRHLAWTSEGDKAEYPLEYEDGPNEEAKREVAEALARAWATGVVPDGVDEVGGGVWVAKWTGERKRFHLTDRDCELTRGPSGMSADQLARNAAIRQLFKFKVGTHTVVFLSVSFRLLR